MNSIMIPAVMPNQMAAKTGAVVRNFFIDVVLEIDVVVEIGWGG